MPNPTTRRHPLIEVEIITYSGTVTIRNDENEIRNSLLSVNTSKSMAAPAGTFTIRLKPQKDEQGLTMADKLKAMDMVIIRMSPDAGQPLRVIMRGLIDNARLATEVQGNQGQEFVHITGRDFGKLFLIHRAYYFKALQQQSPYFAENQYGFTTNTGDIELKPMIQEIFTKIFQLSSDLKYTNGQSVSNLVELLVTDTAGFAGDSNELRLITDTLAIQSAEGTIWNLIQMYANSPWNEMFVRDDDDTSRLIVRHALLKNFSGDFTQPPTEDERNNLFKIDVDGVRITDREILMRDIGRSDAEVKTLFYTVGKSFLLTATEYKGASVAGENFFPIGKREDPRAARENPFLGQLASDLCGIDIYGIRPMEITSNYIALKRGKTKAEHKETTASAIELGKALNKVLVENYKHNVYLESGTLTIIGDNRPRVGYYLKVEDNLVPGGEFDFYIEGVSHKFTAFGNWTTTLQVTRGDRWIKRFGDAEVKELERIDTEVVKKPLKIVETKQILGSPLEPQMIP